MAVGQTVPVEQISTCHLLAAIDEHGPRWTAQFASSPAAALSEALGRELYAGTLLDAATLAPRGRRVLAQLRMR